MQVSKIYRSCEAIDAKLNFKKNKLQVFHEVKSKLYDIFILYS